MAFNSNPGRTELTASAGQTVFPFLFKIYDDGDIKVYQTPAGDVADDTADLLTLTTDYTVSITGDTGGDITLVSGATINDSITIVRELDIDRDTEFQTSGDLLADTLNIDQNYQTYLIADQEANSDRQLRLPASVQGVSADLPAPIADAYFKWNVTADAIENDTTIPDAVISAADSASASEDSNLDAGSWANEDEDVAVKEYTDGSPSDRSPTVYSALHWAAKASVFNPTLYALLAGATFTGQVKGITPIADEDLTRKDFVETNMVNATADVIAEGQDWAGVSYTDTDAIGANPTALIYPDGTIRGSTDNGSYVKYPNGDLEVTTIDTNLLTVDAAEGNIFKKSPNVSTLPIAFVTTIPVQVATTDESSSVVWTSAYNGYPTLTTARAWLMSAVNTRTGRITYKLTGRWK
jgi:hypothetical protein